MKLARIFTLPPVLAGLCVTIGIALQSVAPISLGAYPFRAGLIAGIALLLVAAGFGGWAYREMARRGTPVEPGHDPSVLVTSGPFAVSRNPLYVSLITVVLALAVMVNVAWLVVSAIALFVLLDRVVVRAEERRIEAKFPAEYGAYRSRVRRWL